MHRVPKEMKESPGNRGPWDYPGSKACPVPRVISVYLALQEYQVLRGSPALAESQGSQESRVRGGRSERQDSQGPRDPKVFLEGPGKTELLDTREKQVEPGTEDPKENGAIRGYLEGGASKARGVAPENPAPSDRAG